LSPLLNSHDICGICKWEDDPVQNNDPDYSGGANHISLNEAKQAFAEGKALRPLKRAAIQRWKEREAALEASLLNDEEENAVPERELALV
jgi:hypothetical protein